MRRKTICLSDSHMLTVHQMILLLVFLSALVLAIFAVASKMSTTVGGVCVLRIRPLAVSS